MAEARQTDRARALLGAQIVTNNRNSTIECQVRNISASGAKLLIGDTVSVPEEFEISIPQKGRSYNARVVWRTARETGIEFVAGHADDVLGAGTEGEADEARRKLKSLEVENAALRKKISELQYRIDRWSELI